MHGRKYLNLIGIALTTLVFAVPLSAATLPQDQAGCVIDCDLADEPLSVQPNFSPFAPRSPLIVPPNGAFGETVAEQPDIFLAPPSATGLFPDASTAPLPGVSDSDGLLNGNPFLLIPSFEQ